MPTDTLTSQQAALAMGIKETTLRGWRFQKKGPKSFKLGTKKVAYRRSDVEEWLDEQYKATVRGPGDKAAA